MVVYVGLAILHSTIVIQEILTIKLPSIFDEYTQQCNDENYNIPETCDIMIVTCDIMIVTCDIMIVTFALKYEVALAANMDQFLIQGKLCEIATEFFFIHRTLRKLNIMFISAKLRYLLLKCLVASYIANEDLFNNVHIIARNLRR